MYVVRLKAMFSAVSVLLFTEPGESGGPWLGEWIRGIRWSMVHRGLGQEPDNPWSKGSGQGHQMVCDLGSGQVRWSMVQGQGQIRRVRWSMVWSGDESGGP